MDIFIGLVMVGYPGYHGLGHYEPIRMLFEDEADFSLVITDWLDLKKTTILIVSKKIMPSKLLSEYFYKNEKQKLAIKFQTKG